MTPSETFKGPILARFCSSARFPLSPPALPSMQMEFQILLAVGHLVPGEVKPGEMKLHDMGAKLSAPPSQKLLAIAAVIFFAATFFAVHTTEDATNNLKLNSRKRGQKLMEQQTCIKSSLGFCFTFAPLFLQGHRPFPHTGNPLVLWEVLLLL